MKNSKAFEDAKRYYDSRLQMSCSSRINHLSGALLSEQAESLQLSEEYYRTAANIDPHNIMIRNDLALNLKKQGRSMDAIEEFRKALIISNDQPTLCKNISCTYAGIGDFSNALSSSKRALQLNPSDAVNHRNIAKIYDAIGDSGLSLNHHLQSIKLDIHNHKPDSSSYRSAAVQIIAKGGSRDEAHNYMNIARSIENKRVNLPSSQRTHEIVAKILLRKGNNTDL